jgi:hypothetical protein
MEHHSSNLVFFSFGLIYFGLISDTHPLYPPLKQVQLIYSIFPMFERGKELERGRSPLSPELPSPAINIYGVLPVFPAGEGIKG